MSGSPEGMSSRLAARDLACWIWLRRAGAWVPLTQRPISLNRNPSLQTNGVPGHPWEKIQIFKFNLKWIYHSQKQKKEDDTYYKSSDTIRRIHRLQTRAEHSERTQVAAVSLLKLFSTFQISRQQTHHMQQCRWDVTMIVKKEKSEINVSEKWSEASQR